MRAWIAVLIALIVLSTAPCTIALGASPTSAGGGLFLLSDSGLLQGVPYVWQEINGFCAWAGTSILLQYAGVPLDLHEVFALTGVGFGFVYIRYNDTMLIFPGALYQQIDPVQFVSELYGLNYSIYFGDELENIDLQAEYLRERGLSVGILDGEDDAFALMRSSIDEGHPLLISVDPTWLPSSDYDTLREQGLTGGGHAVVIVGYNDTSGVALITDPGVGSFGSSFGYPSDGRGNYTQISYTNLNTAWSTRYYISIVIKPGGEPVDDKTALIGPYIRDMLLGAGETYAPGSSSAYLWSFGQLGFRKLGEDMTPEALKGYLSVFDDIDNEINFKASLLKFIGLGIEAQVTLQYLSYRAALPRLPAFMPEIDLDSFVTKGEAALPHLASLSNNDTLILPGNLSAADGLASTVLGQIADMYNSTEDIDASFDAYAEGLSEVSAHLTGIADSWRDAGNELALIWPTDPLVVFGPYIFVAAAGVAAVVLVALHFVRKSPSG